MARHAAGWLWCVAMWVLLMVQSIEPALAQSSQSFPGAYPGVIALDVDVTDVQRRIFSIVETIPAKPGRLELYYPAWIPGHHAPRGPIDQLSGLQFRVNGQQLPWKRDPLDVYKFVLDLPAGTQSVEARFELATPQTSEQGRIVVTANVLNVQWNQVVLYPVGYRARDIQVQAALQLPAGWQYATALRPAAKAAESDHVAFAAVPLEVLVDSPVFAGNHFHQYDLTPAGSPPVLLNVFAVEAGDLAATDAQLAIHRAVIREAYAALGPPHYDHYDVLLALTDELGGVGLEHHRSTEITEAPAYFRSWDEAVASRDTIAHEFTHSWNGKYRRPARLWTPHFNTPMQDDLLWVYEGMTQYYGNVLAARAGLVPADFTQELWASVAATFDARRPGRDWRSVEDTTYQPVISPRRPLAWVSWQRTEDYYQEGVLLWLDVDTRLRELTHGQRSLDDFAKSFFAAPANEGWVSTYELDDVARALNAVAPLDWAAFLKARVEGVHQPLLDGITRAGYRLVFSDKPNKAIADTEKSQRRTDLGYSLGVVISRDNVLSDVVWDGPAFKAGLTTNTTLIAVNGRAYNADLLKRAITDAAAGGPLVELIVRNQDRYRTVTIDYRGGLRYPHLEAIPGSTDSLKALFAPRSSAP